MIEHLREDKRTRMRQPGLAALAILLTVGVCDAHPTSQVLMGMRLESAHETKGAITLITSGAKFLIRPNGLLTGWQRIPRVRKVLDVKLPASILPCHLRNNDDFSAAVACQGGSLEFHGDSVIILKIEQTQEVGLQGWFKPAYHFEKEGKGLLIDAKGGFGVYPVAKKNTSPPELSRLPWNLTYKLSAGEEVWLSVFPPRPYNWRRAFESLDHEMGNLPSDDASRGKMDELIASTAKHCKVFALHAGIWRDTPEEFKAKTGMYAGQPQPWMTDRHVPADLNEFFRVREEAHRNGMKLVVYLSPYYSKAPDIVGEMKRVLAEYQVDGLYFDGISLDFRKSYRIIRQARQLLGDDRILYVHCSEDPLLDPRIYCPFIDTYADYILRGEAGRRRLPLETFLRWTISGYNISNAVGYWCYYGSNKESQSGDPSEYLDQVPNVQHVDAALRNEARIWRQGESWSLPRLKNDLTRFDEYYFRKLAKLRNKKLP